MPSKNKPYLHAAEIAVAALTFGLASSLKADKGNRIKLQVLPSGTFMPSDGREMESPPWNLNAASADAVIQRFNARTALQPLVIDYEHQTLNKEKNGQPAPAAAWIRSLSWTDGSGLFAEVELTDRAHAAIDAKEYLFFSPVFSYDKNTGTVLEIFMGALTNTPGIHGMQPLSLLAAATAAFLPAPQPHQESPVNPLLNRPLKNSPPTPALAATI